MKLPWYDFMFHALNRAAVELVEDCPDFEPHLVVRFHDLPGLGTVTALIVWAQRNRGRGCPVNEVALARWASRSEADWVYLLRLPGNGRVPKGFDDVLKIIGTSRPEGRQIILGRLVTVTDLIHLFAEKRTRENTLRRVAQARPEEQGDFCCADLEDFEDEPLNAIVN